MSNQIDTSRFKTRVYNVISSLTIIRDVKVTRDEDKKFFYITNENAFAPDFELKYSEQYNCYHVYIHLKNRHKDCKENDDYAIMVIDSSLAACDFVNVVQTLYRRRAGKRVS